MTAHDNETKNTENTKVNLEHSQDGNDSAEPVTNPEQDNMSGGNNSSADNESGEIAPPSPQEEISIWKDKYMRLSAEFDNFRKRTLREKLELAQLGGENVVKSLLPVLDDMDRAIDAMRRTEDIDSVRSGIELIRTKLTDTLKQQGLSEIEAVGHKLDTDFHEAVAKVPAPDKKQKGCIVDVAQKGYSLKDKVIRHAKVVVGE